MPIKSLFPLKSKRTKFQKPNYVNPTHLPDSSVSYITIDKPHPHIPSPPTPQNQPRVHSTDR